MNLKEISLFKDIKKSKFQNANEELSFITQEKKKKNQKILKKDTHKLSGNIIKEKVVIKQFTEELLKLFKSYNQPESLFIDLEKYAKIIIKYQRKAKYLDTVNYIETISDRFNKHNQILQYIRKYREQHNSTPQEILAEIFNYNGGPFEKTVDLIITSCTLELNFRSIEDQKKFCIDICNLPKQEKITKGIIIYDIQTNFGNLNNIIIYNEEYIDNIIAQNKDYNKNKEQVKQHMQKIAQQHERQHSLTEFLRKESILSIFEGNAKSMKEMEFKLFITKLSGEILSFYRDGGILFEEIQNNLVDKYHTMYKKVAQLDCKAQVSDNNTEDMTEYIYNESQRAIKKYTTNAMYAIASLKKANFTKEEIISYLMTEPLTK